MVLWVCRFRGLRPRLAGRPTRFVAVSEVAVAVRELSRHFVVPERDPGVGNALRSLVQRRTRTVAAVESVSFDIGAGEVVGFLGPNGAGKTTTIKMLAGLLHPSSGTVSALGYTPSRRDHGYLRRIALVMGNRRSLAWDLPALDSYELRRAVYSIPDTTFRSGRDELVDTFGIGGLVTKPVRNLSLGERMKVELVGSLLHEPELLFLDEPTLGLDVSTQLQLRSFVADYSRRTGASVLLTSHYMADVQALADRVLVIADGRLMYDGGLEQLTAGVDSTRILDVTLATPADLSDFGEIAKISGNRVALRIERSATAATTARLMAAYEVIDLTVADPPIEEVVARLFESGAR